MLRVMQICSAPYLITSASKKDCSSEDMIHVTPECVFPTDHKIDQWIQNRTEEAGLQSSKMKSFVNIIDNIRQTSKTDKTVVFANFTSTLRIAQDALIASDDIYNQKTVFVHGKITSGRIRDDLFGSFRTDPKVTVLLMTLKLGSVGLNLTEAVNVIFLEPWYSYAALSQGAARVHRIGQMNPVHVYYLLGKDSIEERVFQIAMDKRKLTNDIICEQDYKLGVSDMETILFEL
jgi:SNF2 family DNA or RNA helicase